MDIIIQIFFNSIFIGSIYFLISIGFTLIYGILRVIHFAHVDVGVTGVFIFLLLNSNNFPVLLALLVAMIFTAVIGILVYQIGYKPFLKQNIPRLTPLVVSIGIALILQHLLLLKFGDVPYSIGILRSISTVKQLGGASFKYLYFIGFGVAVLLAVILSIIIKFSKFGRNMRAISEDYELALVLGVRPNSIIVRTFAFCSIFVFFGIFFIGLDTAIFARSGILPTIKGFTISIIGGVGSIWGTFLVAMGLSFFERIVGVFVTSGMKDIVVFIVLIGVLFIKPEGLVKRK